MALSVVDGAHVSGVAKRREINEYEDDAVNPVIYKGRPLRVCVVGADQTGWALDTEARLARKFLSGAVEVVDTADKADVLHCVWPENTASRWSVMGNQPLAPHVLSFSNAPFSLVENPKMMALMAASTALIAQSGQALRDLKRLGFENVFHVPYIFDEDGFTDSPELAGQLANLRAELGIPENAYVVGNFFRDTQGGNLDSPKRQKGADVFLAMLKLAARKIDGGRLMVLLTGPRRHWLRRTLAQEGIPFRYYGPVIEGDDYPANIQPKSTLNLLYRLCDITVVPSRWEGAPRAIIESALTGVPVISARVGIAEDTLPGPLLFNDAVEGAQILVKDANEGFAKSLYEQFSEKFRGFTSGKICAASLRDIYAHVAARLSSDERPQVKRGRVTLYPEYQGRGIVTGARRVLRYAERNLYKIFEKPPRETVVNLWNNFMPPPYGGANQFYLALEKAFTKRGVTILRNDWKRACHAHIFNAIWFDYMKVAELRAAQPGNLFIHRVNGPISIYRGTDPSENDDKVFAINRHMDFTAFQSIYSLTKSLEMGYNPVRPCVVRNSVDPDIFHARGRVPYDGKRKLRIVSTSWSGNVRKGRDTFAWLDGALDFSNIEYTFVGRCEAEFKNIKTEPPAPSEVVAGHLRWADMFVFASAHESASNSVSEALACGAPVIYLDSGGTREIVGMGGLSYTQMEEIPALIERIADNHEAYVRSISIPSIDEIVEGYMAIISAGTGK
ncbi:MAG: glycosyltransferase [Nitrospinae bacterium]|nr:glycosyltransferase [Nitrospinota bacterium]